MSLGGLMMHANWDGISMAPPQLQSYKPERPVYSTPHPVQSTPANNECKPVELRGAKVASFMIEDEEYICLPQAFDLFLKHLVGGLHTVYTKLKRLNITPVVCNVEQVRVLRGLGAIQPGVNRCKLITRKDFETLYQDCTTASRPGRPPKRFPILPPSELMHHHPNARAMNPQRGIHSSADLNSINKWMRMDPDASLYHPNRRISTSPTRRSPPTARPNAPDEHYADLLQQALRQQYQHFIAKGLHMGMSPQHGAINPALAPLIGMSNPGIFNGSIPHSLISQLNSMYARGRDNPNAQLNNEEHRNITTSPRQEKTEASDRSPDAGSSSVKYEAPSDAGILHCNDKSQSRDDRALKSSPHHGGLDAKMNDPRNSPITSNSITRRSSVGNVSVSSFDSGKKSPAQEQQFPRRMHTPRSDLSDQDTLALARYGTPKDGHEKTERAGSPMTDNPENDWQSSTGNGSISSMQTLLSNIQGLLKVAADNARLQDKQLSFEIADLKNKIRKEKELREMVERELEESERKRASIMRKLNLEREAVRRLQQQKLANHEKIPQSEENDKPSEEVDVTSSPSEPRSEPCSPSSQVDSHTAHHLQGDSNAAAPTVTESSEFSPAASSPSAAVSPGSVNDCSSYWPARSLAMDVGSHRSGGSVSHSPERVSPISLASAERNWMSHNLVQSSSCAK